MGFMVYDLPIFNKELTGREYFYNKSYELCNSMLFTTHPIDSARFLLIVFNEQSSLAAMGEPGLLCLYAHSDSALFKAMKK